MGVATFIWTVVTHCPPAGHSLAAQFNFRTTTETAFINLSSAADKAACGVFPSPIQPRFGAPSVSLPAHFDIYVPLFRRFEIYQISNFRRCSMASSTTKLKRRVQTGTHGSAEGVAG
jgi:hypothetical protein